WSYKGLLKIYTERELDLCKNQKGYNWNSLAGRYAMKEAVIKTFIEWAAEVSLKDIEVLKGYNGEPKIILHGQAKKIANNLSISTFHGSISHDAGIAGAMVIAEK